MEAENHNSKQLGFNFSENENGSIVHSMQSHSDNEKKRHAESKVSRISIDDLVKLKRIPSTEIILQTCGAKEPYYDSGKLHYHQDLIQSACHGLEECSSLETFYPYLDFDELIAFAGKTFTSRSQGSQDYAAFKKTVPNLQIYDIFNMVYGTMGGMAKLNSRKRISSDILTKAMKMSPYKINDMGLKQRLDKVSAADVEKLKKELTADANRYIFEIDYERAKRELDFETSKLRIMDYQGVYPNSKNNTNNRNFAGKIHRIIKSYYKEE